MRHQKVTIFHMNVLILSTVFYDKGHNGGGGAALNTTHQNFHHTFLNNDFSVNICSILPYFTRECCLMYSRGKPVSNL